ncbi:MAG: zinc ribbon domain regulatory protein CdsZ [Parachlamydiales bacterium]
MKEALKTILQLQELDMNMIRLMGLKRRRQEELENIHGIRKDLEHQLARKEHEVLELKKTIKLTEVQIREMEEKVEKYEKQQATVKKVDEFNALSQQITGAQREKASLENANTERAEQLLEEEELLKNIKESLEATQEGSKGAVKEIQEGVATINEEGKKLRLERDKLAQTADPEVLAVYNRLLGNKKDRVVVPIENRACSGCNIVITPQHENLVRKGERLVFCEHCSRIHYWPEEEAIEEGDSRRRRRRKAVSA